VLVDRQLLGLEAGQHVAGEADRDVVQLADLALADELEGAGVVRARALLAAHLHHPVVLASRPHHGPPLGHGQGQRLLDVDVLAGAAGHHRHQRVPVVGRGDDHRVDVLVVEQVAEIPVRRGLPAGQLHALVQVGLVDVADGHRLDLGAGQEVLPQRLPLVAAADDADADALAGSRDAAARQGRGRAGQGQPPGELASIVHDTHTTAAARTVLAPLAPSSSFRKREVRTCRIGTR
jgi:hypothetical protein